MHYVVLLYGNEEGGPRPGTPEWDADLAGYFAFDEMAADHIVGGAALEPVATAITVRVGDGGAPRVTHGPFAESAEVLGGFYVLDAPTLDDAIELARQIPAASDEPTNGAIEIRPAAQWFDRETEVQRRPDSVRYMVTIHGTETDADDPGSSSWEDGAAAHEEFVEKAGDAVLAGGALHPTHSATTIRVRGGELLVTDGPFAEAIEVVGGLYVLQAGSEQEAVELAGLIPVPADGAVEVRPVMEFEE